MPKGNAMSKKRPKKNKLKSRLNASEQLLAKLHELVKNGHQNASTASSLIEWYIKNKHWTEKQIQYAEALTRKKKKLVAKRNINFMQYKEGL